MKLKKWIIIVSVFLLILVGCSSKQEDVAYENDGYYKLIDSNEINNTGTTTSSSAKLVYRASLNLQTQKFDDSYQKLKELVEKYQGFFEDSEISYGSYYDDESYRTGNFTIRIPTEKYEEIITEICDSIYVASKSESTENISQSYYEVQTHINSLEIEITRLQELMKQAEDMSDIIEIEKALTEAENELESYQTTLSSYDTLINYSTITIYLREVVKYKDSEANFLEKIKDAFVDGITNVVEFAGNFVLFVVGNIVTIGAIAIVVVLIRKKKIFTKIKERFSKKQK